MNIYAFPSGHDPKTGTAQFGMNLRDYFAAKAMQKFESSGQSIDEIANLAYKMADEMMKAREL